MVYPEVLKGGKRGLVMMMGSSAVDKKEDSLEVYCSRTYTVSNVESSAVHWSSMPLRGDL